MPWAQNEVVDMGMAGRNGAVNVVTAPAGKKKLRREAAR